MISLSALWLPIVLAAVIVFVASSVIHMLPLWHRGDYQWLAHEAQVAQALRPLALPPGDYFLPWAEQQQMKAPEYQEKLRQGPVAMLTILPNRPVVMWRPLALWFLYLLLVCSCCALLAARVLPGGTAYPQVFRLVLIAAFMGYSLALIQNSIWLRRSWSVTLKNCFDGLLYAGLTAGTFGWLWPH